MARIAPGSHEAAAIHAALDGWRQGDVALGENWFVHSGDPGTALTEAAAEIEEAGLQALTSEVDGLVVVSQTCDVVRDCVERPYVEVSPLVRVDGDDLIAIQRGRRPAFASLPALNGRNLVVDLDRVMTVEKAVVAKWVRTPGYTNDAEGRAFAQALARKRARFAFPDDFILLAKKLQSRLVEKHDKDSDEGRGLRSLREIRVQASPSWGADVVDLWLWFVRNEQDATFEGKNWADLLKAWLKLVPAMGRFRKVEGVVVTLDDMSAAEHVASDALDLDHLSFRTEGRDSA